MLSAERKGDLWRIETQNTENGETAVHHARMLVNAGGPWVGDIIQGKIRLKSNEGVRLVRGSHIVTRRLFDHDKCYIFQGTDGRIVFAIPYETDFTLIGTTDAEHHDPSQKPECTPEERQYLIDFVNQYLASPIAEDDVVWTYSGVRPLYDDGATSATAATRDYTLKVDARDGAPVLNIFGGKITTYRRLAEGALEKIGQHLTSGAPWTRGVPLPGGNFPVDGFDALVAGLRADYGFLDAFWARRLARAYGTEAREILGRAQTPAALGRDFGATLTEAEVKWMMTHEFARTAEDVIWRRTKLGLRLKPEQVQALDGWMAAQRSDKPAAAE